MIFTKLISAIKNFSPFRPQAGQQETPEDMVLIPEGPFGMGYIEADEVEPLHTVHLNSFYIDKYPVTFEEYDRFCAATDRPLADDEGMGRGKHPVINVSWFDAVDYAAWAGKRLPTEAEWEKAVRGGTSTYYFWTEEFYGVGWEDYVWSRDNSRNSTHPVGEKKPNPFGLYDMIGHVYEWCSDWYAVNYYKSSPEKNPQGPTSGENEFKVKRGGSWLRENDEISSSGRSFMDPSLSSPGTGFRCVKDLSPNEKVIPNGPKLGPSLQKEIRRVNLERSRRMILGASLPREVRFNGFWQAKAVWGDHLLLTSFYSFCSSITFTFAFQQRRFIGAKKLTP